MVAAAINALTSFFILPFGLDDNGVRSRQAAIHGDGLSMDVGGRVGRQKQSRPRDFLGSSGAPQGVELSDSAFAAAGAGPFEYWARHSGFDQTRANGVDAHARAGKLVGRRLHQTDDTGLAGAVRHAAGAGTQPRDRRRADDRAAPPRDHGDRGML